MLVKGIRQFSTTEEDAKFRIPIQVRPYLQSLIKKHDELDAALKEVSTLLLMEIIRLESISMSHDELLLTSLLSFQDPTKIEKTSSSHSQN